MADIFYAHGDTPEKALKHFYEYHCRNDANVSPERFYISNVFEGRIVPLKVDLAYVYPEIPDKEGKRMMEPDENNVWNWIEEKATLQRKDR